MPSLPRRLLILSIFLVLAVAGRGQTVSTDSTASRTPATTTISDNRNWLHLIKKGELDMKDTTVQYPRFLKFCVGVYNWADRVFNSYDTTYVSAPADDGRLVWHSMAGQIPTT